MKNWFSIQAKAGSDSADVLLFDEIGAWGVTAKDFVAQVKATGAKKLTVRINSPGGSIFEGLAIYNFLAGYEDVTTVVEGLAASMASVIALAGKTRKIAANAFFMVHSPMVSTFGNADELRQAAELLDKLKASLASIYEKRTGASAKTVEDWMSTDTWFDGSQALAAGLATEVTGASTAVASLRPSFQNVPAALSATPKPPQNTPRMNKLMEALAKAGVITAADVTEDAAVTQANAAIARLTKERDDAVNAKNTAETALATARKANATALVEAAVADGRIEASAKDEWIARLSADEGASKLIASIKKPVAVGHPGVGANTGDPQAKEKTLTEKCLEANKKSAAK